MKKPLKEGLTKSIVNTPEERRVMRGGTLTVTAVLECNGASPITLTISQGDVFPSDTTPAILILAVENAIASWVETSRATLSSYDENTGTVSLKTSTGKREKL